MKVSVVITILNEQESIAELLKSLLKQTKKPDEIVIVDAGSTDRTIEIIKSFKSKKIKLFVKKGISRSKGRNLGIKFAKSEIIAITDAGCVAKKDWLEKITKPLNLKKSEVAAGFYIMTGKTNLQKAFACFLGILPKDFNADFLPSARSLALTKSAWKKAEGFPTNLKDTAEDTIFNFKLLAAGVKIIRVKSARVEWGMPKNLIEFAKKIFNYAKGDMQAKIIYHQAKGLSSHNIKVSFVFLRYLVAGVLQALSIYVQMLLIVPFILIVIYAVFSFFKIYLKTKRVEISVYGPLLQIICDLSVMLGFISGLVNNMRDGIHQRYLQRL